MTTRNEQHALPFPAKPEPIRTGCYRREFHGVLCDFEQRGCRLIWCSDWGRVWQLPLRRVHHGADSYSHTDFYDPQGPTGAPK